MTDDEVKALIERAAGIVGTNPPANKGLRAENGAEYHKQELMRAVAEKRAKFEQAIDDVFDVARRLIDTLTTDAPARDRDIEAAKAKARVAERFGRTATR